MIRNKIKIGLRHWFLCGVVTCLCITGAQAQDNGATPVLHVYTNLLQLPVLVLGPAYSRMEDSIPADKFSVSIDSGPLFHATHVRREGDDPISLSVLIDLNGEENQLRSKISSAIVALAPELHAADKVSIYTMSCALMRTASAVPADKDTLQKATDNALAIWDKQAAHAHGDACAEKEHLWDSMLRIVAGLKDQPGRKAILVMSDGHDQGSKYKWTDVRDMAATYSITVFGFRYVSPFGTSGGAAPASSGGGGRRGGGGASLDTPTEVHDPLQSLCQLSGGIMLPINGMVLTDKVHSLPQMLRDRYIVEFPRPANGTAGHHNIQVHVEKSDVFITTAGLTFPVQDPNLSNDPNTIQAGPANTPQQGQQGKASGQKK